MNRNKLRGVILIIVLVVFTGIIAVNGIQNLYTASNSERDLKSSIELSKNINLTNADASFVGEYSGDYSGWSVAGVGDVNGDNFDDILIGAINYNASNGNEGKVYLIFGDDTISTKNLNLSQANASFIGEHKDDNAGSIIADAGDVNNDNYDDILIGVPNNDEGDGSSTGQTYLIFGNDTGWAKNVNLSQADASFIGEHSGDQAGYSVSGTRDVNGDNFDDILIGAWLNDEGNGTKAGQTYLIFGKNSGWTNDVNLSQADASFIGENDGDRSGFSLDGAGDVNGDDYDDILIGAKNYNASRGNEGKAYLIFGRNSGWTTDINLSQADASFMGEQINNYAGSAIAGAGDVNGDDYDDILIGAKNYNASRGNEGKAYFVFGRNSGWTNDINLSQADASFIGEHKEDRLGGTGSAPKSLTGVGNVNGDNFDDILIGVSGNDEGGDGAGQTYLIYGKETGWTNECNISSADASFIGDHNGDQSGFSVDGAGDVNGDGNNDILIGAFLNDDGDGKSAGKTYLILSPPESDGDTSPDLFMITLIIGLTVGIGGSIVLVAVVLYIGRKSGKIGHKT